MPSRHGQPDPSDETTQQAYYGQQSSSPQQHGPQQPGQYQSRGSQQSQPQGGYPPPGQGQYGSQGPSGPPPQSGPAPAPGPKKRKKWPFIVGGVVLLFIIIGVANGGGSQPTTPTGGQAAPSAAPSAAPAPGSQAPAASDAPAATEGIVYEVTGKGRASNITYSSNGTGGISQQNNAKLPFKKTVPTGDGLFGFFSLTAQNGQGSGTISCKITKDGEVINENTSEGPYAVVTCQGS